MSILVACPGCGKRYKVGDSLADQPVRCGCGKTLHVPQPPVQAEKASAEDQLDESAHDLLDETIWDTDPKVEPPAETTDAGALPATPAVADSHPRPTTEDDTEDEPEPFWDRAKSPSRELIAWLAIGYGAAMTLLLLVPTILTSLLLVQASGLSLIIFLSIRLTWLALAVLIAVGGVLIRKQHPLGPSCAGLASAGTCLSWLLSLLFAFLPIHIFLAIFAVQFVFIYSVPAYIIYWCLKEEEAINEAASSDDLYTIRESLKDRLIEENRKEWEFK